MVLIAAIDIVTSDYGLQLLFFADLMLVREREREGGGRGREEEERERGGCVVCERRG